MTAVASPCAFIAILVSGSTGGAIDIIFEGGEEGRAEVLGAQVRTEEVVQVIPLVQIHLYQGRAPVQYKDQCTQYRVRSYKDHYLLHPVSVY